MEVVSKIRKVVKRGLVALALVKPEPVWGDCITADLWAKEYGRRLMDEWVAGHAIELLRSGYWGVLLYLDKETGHVQTRIILNSAAYGDPENPK